MAEAADAVIIGAGIHGSSLAFHLSQRGLKPVVVERRFVAAGATGRSSGLVRMHYDLEPESALAWASFRYFSRWEEIVGGECGFRRTGFLQIAAPSAEGALRANVAMHQRLGIPSLIVTADDVRRLAPSFVTEDFSVAAYEPESGYADPTASASSLLEAARRQGARLVQDAPVTAIRVRGAKVEGVDTPRGSFDAPIVVNAAGAWAAEIGRMAGVELPVTTWRHDTAFFVRPPELGPSHPTVIDFINSMYFRPETGRLTLVGLEDNNPLGLSPEGDGEHALAGFVERAIDRICLRIPAMERGALHSAHGGYDGITPDQRAILDQAGPEGFFVVCGFSGTGFKIGPAVGACMAERILDGRAVTVDITPFRLSRFSEGKPLTGEHAYESIWR
ncbi:MAG TPA: FAD-dependent oxidoreductase [Anaerolineales bacterium]|nr:FAD-dependent oxidoreductase [Anaerolineales bacterium]